MAADLTGAFWVVTEQEKQKNADAPRPAMIGHRTMVAPMINSIATSGGQTARQVMATYRGPGPAKFEDGSTTRMGNAAVRDERQNYTNHTDASVRCGAVPGLCYAAAAVVWPARDCQEDQLTEMEKNYMHRIADREGEALVAIPAGPIVDSVRIESLAIVGSFSLPQRGARRRPTRR